MSKEERANLFPLKIMVRLFLNKVDTLSIFRCTEREHASSLRINEAHVFSTDRGSASPSTVKENLDKFVPHSPTPFPYLLPPIICVEKR